MIRPAATVFLAILASLALAGCSLLGGGEGESSDTGAGPASSVGSEGRDSLVAASPSPSVDPASVVLTNENWELAVQDADSYKGARVEMTGEVFNVLGDSDGYHRFQLYTDPATREGNTHVAAKDTPQLIKKGFQVSVVGTLTGFRVSRSVSGKELKIPEVAAESVEVIGPPSVVTPTITRVPTVEPTATPVPTAVPTSVPPTSTRVPTAEPSSTAAPATTTPRPTVEPSPTEPPSTSTPVPPTETPGLEAEMEASPTPAPAVTITPAAGPLPLSVPVGSARLSGPMQGEEDAGAPGGKYIHTSVSDQEWNGVGDPPPTGQATIQVSIPEDGTYTIWTRMWYEHVDANSYWLVVDEGPGIKVGNDDDDYESWKWVNWHDGSASNKIELELDAGTHTLRLVGREAGTRISDVVVTDDPDYVPR